MANTALHLAQRIVSLPDRHGIPRAYTAGELWREYLRVRKMLDEMMREQTIHALVQQLVLRYRGLTVVQDPRNY